MRLGSGPAICGLQSGAQQRRHAKTSPHTANNTQTNTQSTPPPHQQQLNDLKTELAGLRVAKVTGGAPNKLSKIKTVRKGIARVLTVYRANLRAALKSKIEEDGKNKKGKVRRSVAVLVQRLMLAQRARWRRGAEAAGRREAAARAAAGVRATAHPPAAPRP